MSEMKNKSLFLEAKLISIKGTARKIIFRKNARYSEEENFLS
jgi:hypothetical protein